MNDMTGLFAKLFSRPAPICNPAQLADFVDQQSAFLVQKGIYEYSRARAGHYAKVLFAEKDFRDCVEHARWLAYPLGLAMVGEVVEGVLRSHATNDRHALLDELTNLILSIFDRYPVPPSIGRDGWSAARDELAVRLQRVSMHAVKRAMDVPDALADAYVALMPIHQKLRAADHPALRNYLRVTLCNIHEELIRRMDVPSLFAGLQQYEAATPA